MSWDRNTVRAARVSSPFTQRALFPTSLRCARVYHPYQDWEEHAFGLWRDVSPSERSRLLSIAAVFMGETHRYGAAMLRVIDEWPISCEHNLTCLGMNRLAWIGHAASCLETGAPEDVTREAWHYLTQLQRDAANAVADYAIAVWEAAYRGRA